LAAVGVGLKFKINLVEASEALKSYRQPAGRLRLIKGSKQSQILDDSYNAAPDSTMAALDVLNTISKSRKILVLGEMAELGKKNESGHREVANKILELKIDLVFLIGENTKIVSEHLYKNNFAGKIFWFETSQEAIDLIRQNLQENDYILVKGSQSVRTEKIVKAIMASPSQAANLLVRQGKKWLQL